MEIQNYIYTSLVRRIVEYGSACWDPCRGQINELDRIQKKDAQFTNHTKNSDYETLALRGTVARLCALLKRTVGNGLGKQYGTGCEGLTV